MTDERPDGAFSGILWEYDRQMRAASRHAAAEGHPASPRVVLESYDRTLHPWMHGRRAGDLAERYGDRLEQLGFAIGLCLGVIIYGPGRVARALGRWFR